MANLRSDSKPNHLQYNPFKTILTYKPNDFRRYIVEKRLKALREYSLFTRRSIKVQYREPLQRCTLSVGTNFAGSNIDVLRLAIHAIGFNEVSAKISFVKF